MPVEGVIGGSVCTHLVTIVIVCQGPRCTTWRPIRTANCKWRRININVSQHRNTIKYITCSHRNTWQCTLSGPVQHTGRAQRRSCERFARYARYRQTELQTDRITDKQIYRQTDRLTDRRFAEFIDRCNIINVSIKTSKIKKDFGGGRW